MEKNTVELMDEMEQDLINTPSVKEEPKEYEKLLLNAANHDAYNMAVNLIKVGCFLQKQETSLDFSKLERLDTGKKFKGKYQLFRNLETMQLVFVFTLVENNQDDKDERHDLAPYAYDCLYIEKMDKETYDMVMLAAKKTLFSAVKFGYVAALVLYFVALFYTGLLFFIAFFNSISSGLQEAISATVVAAMSFTVALAATPLIVLMMIKYRQYKEK